MSGNDRISPFEPSSDVFRGVYFLLFGFNPSDRPKVLQKLVDGGGIDGSPYYPRHTHVIVDMSITYDDPICVAARQDGKILVTSLWVHHSFDAGMLQDTTSVMYGPVKSLNGIPGAQSLDICLTGYCLGDRTAIMTMTRLMGAKFSMDLVTKDATHLICNKFEGRKYEVASKFNRIKIVNHQWLEDCLKAWEIVSEADYDKSGYELETLKAKAKDSKKEAKYYQFWGKARVALEIMRRENDRSPSEKLAEATKILQTLDERLNRGREVQDPHALLSEAIVVLRKANDLFSTHINEKYGGKANPEFFFEMIQDVMALRSQVILEPDKVLKKIDTETLARIYDYAFQYFRGLAEKDLDSEKPAAQDVGANANKMQRRKRPRIQKKEPEDKVLRWPGGFRENLGIGPPPGCCVNCGVDHWAAERGT